MPVVEMLVTTCCLGFAFAGLVGSGFEAVADREVSFRRLHDDRLRAILAVPVLVFAAPLVIVRRVLLRRHERSVRFLVASLVVASLWSALCGRLVLDGVSQVTGG